MRIMLIDVNYKNSSTGEIVYSLYKYLKNKGHNIRVCYGRGKPVKEDDVYKFGLDLETVFHAGMTRITGYNGCFSPISTLRLINQIEEFNPDVIHIHELHAYFVNISTLFNYLKSKKIKLVTTLHCEYNYTGKCGHANECKGYENECGNCPQLKQYPKTYFFDRTRQMLKEKKKLQEDLNMIVTTPSEWMRGRIKRSFLSKKDIRVVHNGIDVNIFNAKDSTKIIREKYDIGSDKKLLLGVAPDIMSDSKGGKWMLKVAEKLKESVHLILIGGDISKGYGNVNVVKSINDRTELANYYSAADVFLLCSNKETFSMTCAEALSCGTPVVGFKAGAPETVFAEPYAKFVEYGNLDSLINAIKERLYNPINMSSIKDYAKNSFSDVKMCENYESIYLELIES